MKLSQKRVLVTGADGFIGSHLVELLLASGCRVRALAYYNAFNNWGWLDSLPKSQLDEIEVMSGDVRDPGSVREAVRDMEVIFHLAALIGIPYSYVAPESYVATNVMGTLNILQAARDQACERVLVTSTSEVYGTAQYVPIDEQHPMQGQSPYSATKISGDRIAESFYRSFQLPVVIVRPFNTYGPRQSARAIVPTIVAQLLSGRKKIHLGSLFPTRDLVYVKDTVQGFLALAQADDAVGEEVNIATQKEIQIGVLVEKLIAAINPEVQIVTEDQRMRPEHSEVGRLLGSHKKLQSITGWTPKFELDVGLASTIDWFRHPSHLERYKADIYNV